MDVRLPEAAAEALTVLLVGALGFDKDVKLSFSFTTEVS